MLVRTMCRRWAEDLLSRCLACAHAGGREDAVDKLKTVEAELAEMYKVGLELRSSLFRQKTAAAKPQTWQASAHLS